MKKLSSSELRQAYLDFFKKRGHAVIPSASLIPENDPTVLFTTAGMHPLVPYLLGEKHPAGTRLTNVQVCIRTGDIDEVGDDSHFTFFEMLGNWSLGDYFKKEAIAWSWEFLTGVLGIDKARLAVSVFAGDGNAPRDEESAGIWRSLGMENIFYLPAKNNWWGPAGLTGPCGPDTEMFVITDRPPCSPECSPACSCGRYLEIWNNVFMEYNKTADGKYVKLERPNVDTGMGLERTITILNGLNSGYETDLFDFAIKKLEEMSGLSCTSDEEIKRAMRIFADHIRTAVFILGDKNGVTPSNIDQGYVLRRLIRRAVRFGRKLNLAAGAPSELAALYIE
ncbi:MAG: alanine--tRNA ligase-related protein, partial [Christensenellales bacterium]